MASVRAAKAAVIDGLSFSPVVQPGVTGAAMLAAFALDGPDLASPDLASPGLASPGLASRDLASFIWEGMT